MKAHPLILALLFVSLIVAGCMALTPEEAVAPTAPVIEIDRSKPRKPIKTTSPVVKTPPRTTR